MWFVDEHAAVDMFYEVVSGDHLTLRRRHNPRSAERSCISRTMYSAVIKASITLVRPRVYVMARNLACQWGKNSWQCALGCVAMLVRWSTACHVVAKTLKCSKIISKSPFIATQFNVDLSWVELRRYKHCHWRCARKLSPTVADNEHFRTRRRSWPSWAEYSQSARSRSVAYFCLPLARYRQQQLNYASFRDLIIKHGLIYLLRSGDLIRVTKDA